jgi:hypothetical protein
MIFWALASSPLRTALMAARDGLIEVALAAVIEDDLGAGQPLDHRRSFAS